MFEGTYLDPEGYWVNPTIAIMDNNTILAKNPHKIIHQIWVLDAERY
jgi:hypothetical protein